MTQRATTLVFLLRSLAMVNFAAIVAVIAPGQWIAQCHGWLGLGPFPTAPIAGYLARSTSLWFAGFGVMLWFMSNDIERHRWLIRFVGWAMLSQGVFMIAIDWNAGLPVWWVVAEGPTCLLLGFSILKFLSNAAAEPESPSSMR